VKLKILLVFGAFVVALSGTAAAKFASHRLTIDGPGMTSPTTINQRRVIDRVSIATLLGTRRSRTARPASTGPSYLLEYDFGVSDEKGSRIETIRQTFYPFAEDGPMVFTPRHQKIDMSYGPVHFVSGWFEVRGRVMQKLRAMGLPDSPPKDGPAAVAAPRLDPPTSRWPWFVGFAALTAGAGAVAGARRRTT
jgi:hypothetical protein